MIDAPIVRDAVGNELLPGDFVVYRGWQLAFGVFIKKHGSNYHVQDFWFGRTDEALQDRIEDLREDIMHAQMGTTPRLATVSYPRDSRKILKLTPESLPENIREGLELTKQLCIFARKIR